MLVEAIRKIFARAEFKLKQVPPKSQKKCSNPRDGCEAFVWTVGQSNDCNQVGWSVYPSDVEKIFSHIVKILKEILWTFHRNGSRKRQAVILVLLDRAANIGEKLALIRSMWSEVDRSHAGDFQDLLAIFFSPPGGGGSWSLARAMDGPSQILFSSK